MVVYRRPHVCVSPTCYGKNNVFLVASPKDSLTLPVARVVVVDSHIQRIVLTTEENTVTHNKSAIDLSNANLACGHKEVLRSTGHIMVASRYSDQQGSKSRQKVMRLYKQWHRLISKRCIKPLHSITRATSIDSDCCRLPTTSILSKKTEELRSNQF